VTIDLAVAMDHFWDARMRGEFFPLAYYDRLTMDEAYRIQLALIERRVAAGERHIGWKVGLTAKAIQEQFSFTSRCSPASRKLGRRVMCSARPN
jgi:2-keto-4-pentenoate hydratase